MLIDFFTNIKLYAFKYIWETQPRAVALYNDLSDVRREQGDESPGNCFIVCLIILLSVILDAACFLCINSESAAFVKI